MINNDKCYWGIKQKSIVWIGTISQWRRWRMEDVNAMKFLTKREISLSQWRMSTNWGDVPSPLKARIWRNWIRLRWRALAGLKDFSLTGQHIITGTWWLGYSHSQLKAIRCSAFSSINNSNSNVIIMLIPCKCRTFPNQKSLWEIMLLWTPTLLNCTANGYKWSEFRDSNHILWFLSEPTMKF